MSKIVNSTTSYLVAAQDYSEYLAQDIYSRSLIETSKLPVIYNGLDVIAGTGLSVDISAGAARGVDITIPDIVAPQPSIVTLAAPVSVVVPASSTGWIILKTNIIEETGTTERQTWDVAVSSVDTSNDGLPVFVTTLPSPAISAYPYSIIVLAQVITGATDVTSINARPYLGNRSFDYTFFQNPIVVESPWLTSNSTNYRLNSDGSIQYWGVQVGVTTGGPRAVTLPIPMSKIYGIDNVSVSGGSNVAELVVTDSVAPFLHIELALYEVATTSSTVYWSLSGLAAE